MKAPTELPFPETGSSFYETTSLLGVRYGINSVDELPELLKKLPIASDAPVFLVTGKTLGKTELLPRIKTLIGARLAGVFDGIGAHSPIADLRRCLAEIKKSGAKALVGLGGGSVIDGNKALSYLHHQETGEYLPGIALPTTLSAAEFSIIAGHTDETGTKVGFIDINISPKYIILDPTLTLLTPPTLWLSTGMRAVDHCTENLYRPSTTIIHRTLGLAGLKTFFTYLPMCKEDPDNLEIRLALQVAAWQALGTAQFALAMGLSHALGHRLGASAGIPHGFCSVICLAPAIRLLDRSPGVLTTSDRQYIDLAVANLPPQYVDKAATTSGPIALSNAIKQLVDTLGLTSRLADYKVAPEEVAKFAGLAVAELKNFGWPSDRIPAEDAITEMVKQDC